MKLMERMKVCVSTKQLLLLCFCFIISSGVEVCDHSAPEGSSYTLPLKKGGFTTNHDLQWKHADNVLVNRKRGRFSKGGAEDINQSGSLILKDLKKTISAGTYIAEVYNADGQIVNDLGTTWNLCVTDKIPKPSVSFACVKKTLTLTCNVSQPKDLSFKWSENGKDVAKETQRTLTRTLTMDKLDTGPSYTCTVYKPGGSETSLPLKPNCPKEPESIFPPFLFGFEFWTMVGILASGGALLLTLIIITICCCSRARRRKRKMLIEEQELRLDWSNPQQQQQYQQHQQQPHQHQHQHNHQQPAGHTGPRQQRSKPAQERERTREVDPDAPKLPKPRGTVDPAAPKLPKLRGGDPSAPKLPKTRGGDPSAPKLPDPQGQGGDLSAPKLPNARASPRLPTAEVSDPGCSIDEGAPLGPRPGDDAAGEEQPPPLPQPRKKVPRAQRGGPDPYAGLR